jgi:hypothetical protein
LTGSGAGGGGGGVLLAQADRNVAETVTTPINTKSLMYDFIDPFCFGLDLQN